MIAEQHEEFQIQSRISGRRVEMGIANSPEARAYIMRSLANLYSDPIKAVIREYSTNGSDAHVEAGNNAPIEVTLPGPLAPFFKVKDYGIGLTATDIEEIYSQYGASTKRNSNAVNGMLGYGCKSAFSYTPQFTVESVKDGVKVTAAVSREADGTGDMTLSDPKPISAPNGTTITVPVKRDDMETFAARAKEFYSYWPKGSVLVGGKEPERFEGLKLADNLYAVEGDHQDRVVMGNVAYPAEGHRIGHGLSGYSVVAFVPIGDVLFTPSREALEYQPKTVQTLKSVGEEAQRHIEGAVQREVDKADTPIGAIHVIARWSNVLPYRVRNQGIAFKWRGKDIPRVFSRGPSLADRFDTFAPNGYYRSRTSKEGQIHYTAWPNVHWLVGYSVAKFTANHRRKLEMYYAQKGIAQPRTIALVPDNAGIPYEWIDTKAQVHQWDDVSAMKLPRTQNPGSRLNGRIPGSYDCFVDGEFKKGVEADNIAQDGPTFFIADNRYVAGGYVNCLAALFKKRYTLVMFPSNRQSKFQRNFPKAKNVHQAIRDEREKWASSLSADVLLALRISDTGCRDALSALDADRVNDPALKRAIRDSQIDLQTVTERRTLFNNMTGSDALADKLPTWTNPLTSYPLYSRSALNNHADHTYMYLNCAHAHNTKEA